MRLVLLLLVSLTTVAWAAPSYSSLKRAGDQALAAKNYDEAILAFERLVRDYPGSDSHNALGFALYQAGRTDRALYQFREALRYNRGDAEALHNFILAVGKKATESTRRLEYTEALNLLDEVISNYSWHPELAVVYYYRGQVLFFRGDDEGGMRSFEQAARRSPSSGTARFLEAVDAERAGRLQEAGTLYQQALGKVPAEPVFRNYYGRLLERLNKQPLALAQFEKALGDNPPPYVDLYLGQSRIYRRLGEYEKAAEALRKARDIRPDYASLHLLLWAVYRQQGFTDAAREELGLAVARDPRPAVAVFAAAPGAEGSLDGQPIGPAPTAAFAPAGNHRVSVKAEGKTVTQPLQLTDGNLALVNFDGTNLAVTTDARPEAVGGRKPAPDLVLKDRTNQRWRLAQFLHQSPVVIVFWSAAESDAAAQLDHLSALRTRLQGKVQTAAVHVDPDRSRDAHRLLLARPADFAQLWGDRQIAPTFGLDGSALPGVVLVDTDGYLGFVGSGPQALGQLEDQLKRSLGISY